MSLIPGSTGTPAKATDGIESATAGAPPSPHMTFKTKLITVNTSIAILKGEI